MGGETYFVCERYARLSNDYDICYNKNTIFGIGGALLWHIL